jgi:hypothetical protein
MTCARCGAESGDRDGASLCEACERRDEWSRLIEQVQAGAAAAAATMGISDAELPADPFRQPVDVPA